MKNTQGQATATSAIRPTIKPQLLLKGLRVRSWVLSYWNNAIP